MHFLGLLNQDIWDVQLAIPDAEAQLVKKKKKINYYLSRLLTQRCILGQGLLEVMFRKCDGSVLLLA